MLAGISADYYLRLEQGRDRNPSVQVLESLARVLRLDDAATAHLLRLGADKPRRRRRRPRRETVPPGIAKLVATLPLPALVEGRYFDVLTANDLATALSPRLAAGSTACGTCSSARRPGPLPGLGERHRGSGRRLPRVRRHRHGRPPVHRARRRTLPRQPRFRQLWARHDVEACEGAAKHIDHPQVGGLQLNRERLGIGGTAGQTLVIYHPDPGTDSADKLALLASVTQTRAMRDEPPASVLPVTDRAVSSSWPMP
ncbi:transcriptional regulator [Streptomyces avermitilis]|uniref:Transcriptional regulator n=1 Tax=Streptomyces avermitilis TaxID=33903 RepID=A0A4D4MII4_STRAX|nr:transcriptional regulator [Streptomyces avermitilis]